jgi:hypothetical protein
MITQISLDDYWMGRDKEYASSLTDAIRFNATKDGVLLVAGKNNSLVNSGWRPPAVNAATPNAAARSRHMTGEACDVHDPDGALDKWCVANLPVLAKVGLWMEHPKATPGWCHLQTVPQASFAKTGLRIFSP